jgi:quercetin dioxygenase-like cupin family protein
MKLNRIDRSKATRDATERFDGEVHVQQIVGPEESHDVAILAVFFSAGARTKPHIHAQDQVLYIHDGRGIVATETERHVVQSGEVVTVPAGTWHWHGATPDSAMCHLSTMKPGETNWEVETKNWASGYDNL